MKGLTATAAVGTLQAGSVLANSTSGTDRKTGGSIRIQHEVMRPKDPRRWDWVQESNLCRGWLQYLVEVDREGRLTPGLIESWIIESSFTEYRLRLRPNVRWNNGQNIHSSDLVWLFNYWCDAEVAGNNMAIRLKGLIDEQTKKLKEGSVLAVSDNEVFIRLARPDVTFLYSLAEYPAAVIHPSTNLDDILSTPIGTGAYLPLPHDDENVFVIEKNPDHLYWGHQTNDIRGGFLDRIEFVDLGQDPKDWNVELFRKNVDLLFQNSVDYTDLSGLRDYRTSSVQTTSTLVARFNLNIQGSAYQNAELRKAIIYAVNNDVVLEIAHRSRGLVGEDHHVCPIHPEYSDIGPAYHDASFATRMSAELSLNAQKQEIFVLDDQNTALTAEVIAAQMRDSGIPTTVRLVPVATYRESWANFPFSLTEWNHRPLGIQNIRLAYHSESAWNETGLQNETIDRLIDQIVGTVKLSDQQLLMRQIEETLRDEFVVIQPYWREITRSYDPKISGADLHPSLELDVHRMHLV